MAYTPADLEIAERDVAQAEQDVAEQERLVTRLRLRGLPTEAADELLSTYRLLLERRRDHLDIIEAHVRA